MTVPIPSNEHERLLLLRELDLLDSAPEPEFDRITQLAADMLDVPVALVSLIDESRQWFKSRVGLDATETPRDVAFCAHAILSDQPLVVNDALLDERFADNPAVLGEPYVRFYTGIPLLSSEGLALGTLCVVDRIPRHLSDKQMRILCNLADLARREIIGREAVRRVRAVSHESQRLSIESDLRFRATFEQASVGIAIVSTDGHWLQVNPKLCDIVGYSAQELLPLTFQQITHPDDLDSDLSLVQQLLDGEIDSYELEKRYIRKSGEPIWIHLSVSLMRDTAGKPLQFISVVENIDARHQAEQALLRLRLELEQRVEQRTEELQRANELLTQAMQAQLQSQASLEASQQQLQTIANNLPIQIAYVDAEERVRFINDTYRIDTGLTPELALGRRLDEILSASFYKRVAAHIAKALAGERVVFDMVTRFRGKEQVWGTVYIPDVYADKVRGFYIMSQDITARKKLEHSLIDKATRDALTGLPNRAALLERLQTATQRARQAHEKLALLFLDLDGFKGVNDQYGHESGDEVLRQFSKRLTATVRNSDMVARLAGDEFVILLEGLHDDVAAERLAEKILQAMQQPFVLERAEALLGSSIGIYIHEPGTEVEIEQMLTYADQAMYEAKRNGKNQLCRFDRRG